MEQTTKALVGAAELFGASLSESQLLGYLGVLQDSRVSDDRLAAGVRAACKVCRFMPKPVDILDNLPEPKSATKYLGARDEEYIPPEEMAFNREAFPLFGQYLRGEIKRDSFLGQFRWAAKKHGIENRIPWAEFGSDVPWEVAR